MPTPPTTVYLLLSLEEQLVEEEGSSQQVCFHSTVNVRRVCDLESVGFSEQLFTEPTPHLGDLAYMLPWLVLRWVIQVERNLAIETTSSTNIDAHATTTGLHVHTVLDGALLIFHVEDRDAHVHRLHSGTDDGSICSGTQLLVTTALAASNWHSERPIIHCELWIFWLDSIRPTHIHDERTKRCTEQADAETRLLQCVQVSVLLICRVGDVELCFWIKKK